MVRAPFNIRAHMISILIVRILQRKSLLNRSSMDIIHQQDYPTIFRKNANAENIFDIICRIEKQHITHTHTAIRFANSHCPAFRECRKNNYMHRQRSVAVIVTWSAARHSVLLLTNRTISIGKQRLKCWSPVESIIIMYSSCVDYVKTTITHGNQHNFAGSAKHHQIRRQHAQIHYDQSEIGGICLESNKDNCYHIICGEKDILAYYARTTEEKHLHRELSKVLHTMSTNCRKIVQKWYCRTNDWICWLIWNRIMDEHHSHMIPLKLQSPQNIIVHPKTINNR